MNGGQAQGKWSVRCRLQSRPSKVCEFISIQCVELLYLSPLQGPARVGIADEEDPEFTKFFGTIMEHEYLDSPELSSQLLLIPRNDRLKLTIASIGVRAFFKRSAFLVAHHDVGHQISAWYTASLVRDRRCIILTKLVLLGVRLENKNLDVLIIQQALGRT
jgi:hypothetical protein